MRNTLRTTHLVSNNLWKGVSLVTLALGACAVPSERPAASALAVTVSGDFEVDPARYSAASLAASEPSSAFNGSTHLVAWIGPANSVVMTRVSASGAVTDPLGVVVGTSSATDPPAVASDGNGFLIVWTAAGGAVRAARIAASGAVTDPGGFVVTTSAAASAQPAVAGDASGYLVAWRDGRNMASTDVDYFAARVGADGAVRDRAGIPALVAPGDQQRAVISSSGTGWLLACEDRPATGVPDLRVGRLDASGAPLDGAGRRVAVTVRDRERPALAWNGANHLLTWSDRTLSGSLTPGVYAQVIDPAGAGIGAAVISVAADSASLTTVARNGTGWIVAGRAPTGLWTARLSSAGALLDATPRSLEGATGSGKATLSGSGGASGYLVARVSSGVAGALRLADDGSSTGGVITLNYSAQSSDTPSVAWDGVNFLAIWRDAETGAYALRRISPAGAMVDATATTVPAHAPIAAAFNGANYVLAWQDFASIDRFTATASWSPSAGLGMTATFDTASGILSRDAPSIGAGGAGHMVAWTMFQGSGSNSRFALRAMPVSASGAPRSSAATSVSSTASGGASPGVSFDGTNFLIAWTDLTTPPFGVQCRTAYAVRLTPAGDLLDATPLRLSGTGCDASGVTSTSDGVNHLVAWSSSGGVFAARVSPAGVALDAPRALTSAAGSGLSASFDGRSFVVAWDDNRSGNRDVYAARVSRDGAVLDPEGVAIARDSSDESGAKIASTRAGQTLVLYTLRTLTGTRVRGRFVTFDAPDAGAADASVDVAADVVIDAQRDVVDASDAVFDAGSDGSLDGARDAPDVSDVTRDVALDGQDASDATSDASVDGGDVIDATRDAVDVADATRDAMNDARSADVADATSVPPPATPDAGSGCSSTPRRASASWTLTLAGAVTLLRRRRARRRAA